MRLLDGARLQDLALPPDQEAVLLQPFGPVVIRAPYQSNEAGKLRATAHRLCGITDEHAERLLDSIRAHYVHRHPDWDSMVEDRWEKIRHGLIDIDCIGPLRQRLIASYFLSEYTFKSTAYFNPSIVPHPDDEGGEGMRVVLSVRAVGEGHISSVAFREGRIGADGTLSVLETPDVYQSGVLKGFRMREGTMTEAKVAEVGFEHEGELGSRILFPLTAATSNGLEDLRLIRFEDGGERTYYGTYTAYDGRHIASQLLRTDDFKRFELMELEGDAVGNKGMGLFPRRVNGHYAMLGRQDAERVWLLYSDDIGNWSGGEVILEPAYDWEFMHMGNCGSPIEIEEGWLILTHGVGPVREYTLGAALVDLDDPSKVIARTPRPLIATDETDRHGYVPNAVYSCGGIVHNGRLVLPFGLADYEVRCMDIGVRDLIDQMERV
ncbi:glycosidase [Parvularcula dongshanensis]|uniref:Putative GH43/DUF377 family glycosyl hydrolase n=1 Tax=Parvularcula dongshanensis TaxID=1173995 RepID=A0A840I163_9PROT|nr:glycosidase [Parvularcula dongshanensis]MBB4657830.1 putative GH43/DUF377 family glycosyl hydrolase [Parvularcula dongshanensis]